MHQADMEIINACGCANWTDCASVTPEDHTRRTRLLHQFRGDVLALRSAVLLWWRQRHPKLKSAQRFAGRWRAVMPHAISGFHPLKPARRDRALLSGRILVGQATAKDDRECCNPRVRMDAEERSWTRRNFGVIQEYERLE